MERKSDGGSDGRSHGLASDAAWFVRGFVINTSNYGSTAAEASYAATLRGALATNGYNNFAFVIDTGRNGQSVSSKGTWCNPKGAGLGRPPTAHPNIPFELPWIKNTWRVRRHLRRNNARFDPSCGGGQPLQGAPQAGDWFDAQFKELVQKATPPLQRPSYTHAWLPASPPAPPRPPPPPEPPPPNPPLIDESKYKKPAWIEEPVFRPRPPRLLRLLRHQDRGSRTTGRTASPPPPPPLAAAAAAGSWHTSEGPH